MRKKSQGGNEFVARHAPEETPAKRMRNKVFDFRRSECLSLIQPPVRRPLFHPYFIQFSSRFFSCTDELICGARDTRRTTAQTHLALLAFELANADFIIVACRFNCSLRLKRVPSKRTLNGNLMWKLSTCRKVAGRREPEGGGRRVRLYVKDARGTDEKALAQPMDGRWCKRSG